MRDDVIVYFEKNKNFILLSTVYFITLAYILWNLIYSIKTGGNSWSQGDWLINNQVEMVRRGWPGSFILGISKYFLLNPLYLLGVIQALIITTIFYSVWRVSIKLDVNNNDVLFFLLISPLFFVFWDGEVDGSLRKEILAYLAFTPYFFYFLSDRKKIDLFIVLSIFLYFIAVFSHEGNAFFVPFFIVTLFLVIGEYGKKLIYYSITYLLLAFCGFLYSIVYNKVGDYMVICKPILEFGIKSQICDGAISWLDTDFKSNLIFTKGQAASPNVILFVCTYILSILIFVELMKEYFGIKIMFFVIFLSSMCFLPLYVVAVDWGRWITLYTVSLTFLIMFWMLNQDDLIQYKFKKSKYYILLIFFLCWGLNVDGYFGVRFGLITGFAFRVLKKLGIVLIDF